MISQLSKKRFGKQYVRAKRCEDAMNAQETADERWRPILGVEQILISVISMLSDPNDESSANLDSAVQFRNDKPALKKRFFKQYVRPKR